VYTMGHQHRHRYKPFTACIWLCVVLGMKLYGITHVGFIQIEFEVFLVFNFLTSQLRFGGRRVLISSRIEPLLGVAKDVGR